MAQTFEQLIAGANKIKQNELPGSNTHGLVGEQLVQMSQTMKETDAQNQTKFTELNNGLGTKSDKAETDAKLSELSNILINQNIWPDGRLEKMNGRFFVNRFFELNGKDIDLYFSKGGTIIKRYYDKNLGYTGGAYTSDAYYVKIGLNLKNSELSISDVEDIVLSINGINYLCQNGLPFAENFVKEKLWNKNSVFGGMLYMSNAQSFDFDINITNENKELNTCDISIKFPTIISLEDNLSIGALDPPLSFKNTIYQYGMLYLEYNTLTKEKSFVVGNVGGYPGKRLTVRKFCKYYPVVGWGKNGINFRIPRVSTVGTNFRNMGSAVCVAHNNGDVDFSITMSKKDTQKNTCDISIKIPPIMSLYDSYYLSATQVDFQSAPLKYGVLYWIKKGDGTSNGFEVANIGGYPGNILKANEDNIYIPILAWFDETIIYQIYDWRKTGHEDKLEHDLKVLSSMIVGFNHLSYINKWLTTPTWMEDIGHTIIYPVDKGYEVRILPKSSGCWFGFLSELGKIKGGETIRYVNDRQKITKETTIVAPNAAKYLAIGIHMQDGTDASPLAVYLNGIDVSKPIFSKIGLNKETPEDISHFMQIFPSYTCVGNSLTAGFTKVDGVFTGSAAASKTKNNWPGYLELRTGRTFNNIAIGSSTAHHWRYGDGPTKPSYWADITTANIPTDAYIDALGVNDIRNSNVVGTASDIKADKADNADTFFGNYDFVVRQFMEYNPNAHVFCMTIPPNEGPDTDKYNAAIRHICSLYPQKVHCIDIYNLYYSEYTTGFLPENFVNGHWNPMAYNYISSLYEKAICKFIYEHYMLFRNVPYNA